MKKTLITLLLLATTVAATAQDSVLHVLFIGNSYTEVNNLPSMVQQAAQSAGRSLSYQSSTPGGCTFAQHCSNASMTLIQQGGWDYVVLQEQSQWPSFPYAQVAQGCYPYAAQLARAVYQHNPDGEAMFYMTWGRKDGDPQWDSIATYEGMDNRLYNAYMYMKEANDASVSPVGRLWRYLRAHHPEIELYQSDGSHPSMSGSYAAACAFYTMLYHRSPLEISYTAGLDERNAATIRQAAKQVVFDSIERWQRAEAEEQGPRVLFLGNSYTSVNNLPALTQRLAASAGHAFSYEASTPSGCTLQQHSAGEGMTLIRQGGWDYVVLQEQSQMPSFPDAQVAMQTMPYAEALARAVYDHNPDGEAMFYMTWGRKDGDAANGSIFPPLATYEGMDSLLYLRYMLMKMRYDGSVSPVGRLWHHLRSHNPSIELYQSDGSHPSEAGSYAAACSFFTLLFHASPLSITDDGGLDAQTALAIRQAADEVVFDSLFIWQRGGVIDTSFLSGDTPEGILPADDARVTLFPNPATEKVSLLCHGLNVERLELCDLYGRRLALPLSETIDLSALPAGIYMLRLHTDGGILLKKIVKQ